MHGHMTSTASIYLPEAKRAKIALTAAHARSAGTEGGIKGMMTKWMRKNLWKKTDVCLASVSYTHLETAAGYPAVADDPHSAEPTSSGAVYSGAQQAGQSDFF